MKKYCLLFKKIGMLAVCAHMAACSSPLLTVSVQNPLSTARNAEMVEIPAEELTVLNLGQNKEYILRDGNNEEIPYQITYQGNIIFPVKMGASETRTFSFIKGKPAPVPTYACGKQYPGRMDDLAWENNLTAYRAYGPALQKRGEKSFGYDVFTKSGDAPALEKRYEMELDQNARKQMQAWRKQGLRKKADSLWRSISYHIDHGNGMDCYNVGATLGGGTNALMVDSNIIYPYCYKEYEILENGPLRLTMKLTFCPGNIGTSTGVVETRTIILDKDSHMNKTYITYNNLKEKSDLAVGLVIHPQNRDGAVLENEKEAYIAYVDSTNDLRANNGVIYLGAVFPDTPKNVGIKMFGKDEMKMRKGALGHVLAISEYTPGKPFLYYWGSGWSKGGVASEEEWIAYLKRFKKQIDTPLKITCSTKE